MVESDGIEILPWEWEHLLAKTAAGAVETDFGGTDRDAELVGDGLVREVVDVAQHDHGPQAGRQVADRGVEFVAQLAQFSSLEQMEGVNENLVALALLQQGNALLEQMTNGSALIGHQVNYTDPTTGQEASGIVESVRVEGDQALLRVSGNDVPLAAITEVLGEPDPAESEGENGETGEE